MCSKYPVKKFYICSLSIKRFHPYFELLYFLNYLYLIAIFKLDEFCFLRVHYAILLSLVFAILYLHRKGYEPVFCDFFMVILSISFLSQKA